MSKSKQLCLVLLAVIFMAAPIWAYEDPEATYEVTSAWGQHFVEVWLHGEGEEEWDRISNTDVDYCEVWMRVLGKTNWVHKQILGGGLDDFTYHGEFGTVLEHGDNIQMFVQVCRVWFEVDWFMTERSPVVQHHFVTWRDVVNTAGDDFDGKMGTADNAKLRQCWLTEIEPPDTEECWRADLNSDGVVGTPDRARLRSVWLKEECHHQWITGIEECAPMETLIDDTELMLLPTAPARAPRCPPYGNPQWEHEVDTCPE